MHHTNCSKGSFNSNCQQPWELFLNFFWCFPYFYIIGRLHTHKIRHLGLYSQQFIYGNLYVGPISWSVCHWLAYSAYHSATLILLSVIMLSVIMLCFIRLSVTMLSVIMLSVMVLSITAECNATEYHYDECYYAECHYVECHYAECHGIEYHCWV